jgi:hypothetical protein
LHDLDGTATAWLGNPGMPPLLRNSDAQIRFLGSDHPIHRYFISTIHLFCHGAPVPQEQG